MKYKRLLCMFLLSITLVTTLYVVNTVGDTNTGYNSDSNLYYRIEAAVTIYGGPKAGGGFYINKAVFSVYVKNFWPGQPNAIQYTCKVMNEVVYEFDGGFGGSGTYVVYDESKTETGYWTHNSVVYADITLTYKYRKIWFGRIHTVTISATAAFSA